MIKKRMILASVMILAVLTTAAECESTSKDGGGKTGGFGGGYSNGSVINNGPGSVVIYYGKEKKTLKGGQSSNFLKHVTKLCAPSGIVDGDMTISKVKIRKGLAAGKCRKISKGDSVIVFVR